MSIIAQNNLLRAVIAKISMTNPARAFELADKLVKDESDNIEREKFMRLALQIQTQIKNEKHFIFDDNTANSQSDKICYAPPWLEKP